MEGRGGEGRGREIERRLLKGRNLEPRRGPHITVAEVGYHHSQIHSVAVPMMSLFSRLLTGALMAAASKPGLLLMLAVRSG